MAIRRSLALLTPKLITSAHHANPLSLAGARGVHLIPLSASASLDHASWSLNDAPSLRSVTAEVSGWLSKQGPHASSVLPIEAVWAQDAAEARMIVPCDDPRRAQAFTDGWRQLTGCSPVSSSAGCAFLQGTQLNPFAAYHVQQALQLGARASVTLRACGTDGVERDLQLKLQPLTSGAGATPSHMLGVLTEAPPTDSC